MQTGSGGGTFVCPGIKCEGITGRIEIVAARGSLNGPTSGTQVGDDPTLFQLTSTLKGTGQFDDGFISISVTGETANIGTIWFHSHGQTFENKDVTTAVSVTQSIDPACTTRSGLLIVTTITTTLENLGPTTITERHCTP